MTHSSSTGGSFRGLSNYLEAEQKMEWKETRNLPGRNREEDLRLMDEVARMSRAEQPVYHLSLNYADADTPTRAQMIADGDQVLEELGLGGHQTMMVAHRDTGHRHLHLMVNRVHPDKTRAWNTWRDRTRIKDILGELEQQRGYQRVSAGREWERAPGLELSDGEFKQLRKRGMEHPPLAVKVEMIGVEEMIREAGSWEEIQHELAKDDLWITDKNRGGVVKDLRTNKTIKLSRIHRDHSFGKLEQRFGKFREYERAFALGKSIERDLPDKAIGRSVARMVREGYGGRGISKAAKGEFRGAITEATYAEKSLSKLASLGGVPAGGPVKYALKAGRGTLKQLEWEREQDRGRGLSM
ncbi:MAG TPA: relaxase/mobilization nuclease domain-containing protein [Fodinibius sp.]|nr:relaxase/mobilization nuclease domain-containing protein [Fodinibius sp.]